MMDPSYEVVQTKSLSVEDSCEDKEPMQVLPGLRDPRTCSIYHDDVDRAVHYGAANPYRQVSPCSFDDGDVDRAVHCTAANPHQGLKYRVDRKFLDTGQKFGQPTFGFC